MYYFAYGSNLSRKQMAQLCPASKPRFSAVLPNYSLVFSGWSRQWRGGIATIKPLRSSKVRGAIYEVTPECLKRLDRQEVGFSRFDVTVFDEDDEPIQAVTYVRSGQFEETAPSQSYLVLVRQGYQDWNLI